MWAFEKKELLRASAILHIGQKFLQLAGANTPESELKITIYLASGAQWMAVTAANGYTRSNLSTDSDRQ